MHHLGRLAQLIGLNSIPVAGVFWRDWSNGTAIACYWCETALVGLFVYLRLVIRQRLAGDRGGEAGESLIPALAFGAGNLVFLAVILGLFPENVGAGAIDFPALGRGVLVSLAFVGLGFLLDLPGIAERPAGWTRELSRGVFGRVALLTLALFVGLFFAILFHIGRALFWIFFGLKLLADLDAYIGRPLSIRSKAGPTPG